MVQKQALRLVALGIMSWLVPFLVSIPMYSREGEPLLDIFLAKSIMIVVAAGMGTVLILVYFGQVQSGYLREGVVLGVAWLVINWALDAVILLPLSGLTATVYMEQIGLRYLVIPIIAGGIGYAADRAVKTHRPDPGSAMF